MWASLIHADRESYFASPISTPVGARLKSLYPLSEGCESHEVCSRFAERDEVPHKSQIVRVAGRGQRKTANGYQPNMAHKISLWFSRVRKDKIIIDSSR